MKAKLICITPIANGQILGLDENGLIWVASDDKKHPGWVLLGCSPGYDKEFEEAQKAL